MTSFVFGVKGTMRKKKMYGSWIVRVTFTIEQELFICRSEESSTSHENTESRPERSALSSEGLWVPASGHGGQTLAAQQCGLQTHVPLGADLQAGTTGLASVKCV